MGKIIVTEWMSLDGIFDASLMEFWFNPYHSESRVKYIQETIHDCEVMLYGRSTYEMLYPYWSSMTNNEMGVAQKLNEVKKYVVSSSLAKAGWQGTTIINDNAIKEIEKIRQQTNGNILIQGSWKLVGALLKARLVDEFKLLIQPHIMGKGERLFDVEWNISLKRSEVQELDKGVTFMRYEIN
jgi:dihydrofolate reductase